MTRSEKRKSELATLHRVIAVLRLKPDHAPKQGETPDFTFELSGKSIGLEVTSYQSGTTAPDGTPLRKVEGGWEALNKLLDGARKSQPALADINGVFIFRGPVPPRSEQQLFVNAVTSFVIEHITAIDSSRRTFNRRHFSAHPLLQQHVQQLIVNRSQYAIWYSDVSTGWLGNMDHALSSIVANKALKQYRATVELWLAIQSGSRISEIIAPIEGIDDFKRATELNRVLASSKFSRVIILANVGTYIWTRHRGWEVCSSRQE